MRNNFTTGVLVAAVVALVAIAAAVVMVIGGVAGAPVVAMIAPLSIGLMNMIRLEQNQVGMEKLTNGFIPETVKAAITEVAQEGHLTGPIREAIIEANQENRDSSNGR